MIQNITPVANFNSEAEAWNWLNETVDDPYTDNYRFAYKGDANAVAAYEAARMDGCCGSADYTITVAGRVAFIGCNYGH